MTNKDQNPEVRRVSRRDQKDKLESRGPLIPDDMAFPFSDGFGEADDAPMTLADLESLLDQEQPTPKHHTPPEKANEPEQTPRKPKKPSKPSLQKVTTPPDERFPPTSFPPPGTQRKPKATLATAPQSARKRRRGSWYHDVIAAVFALATLGAIGFFVLIWQDPYNTALNPFARHFSV